jgi:flavin reductase (DIM6/NTAB) family NADH-FMN oxidoreductase RutF
MGGDAFDRIAATIDPPMVIVTTRAGDEVDGCLVGFSSQCSIDPLHFLVCLSTANRTYEIARRAQTLVVHMLHDDAQDRSLARLFGEQTGHEVDKLAACHWKPGPDGVPVIQSCDWFGGPIVSRVNLGDHVGFALDVRFGSAVRTSEPYLGLAGVRDLDAGNPA